MASVNFRSLSHCFVVFTKKENAVRSVQVRKSIWENRSIPAANATRWNSTYQQLKSVLHLDLDTLSSICGVEFCEAKLFARDVNQLSELCDILAPFAEATELTQGTPIFQ